MLSVKIIVWMIIILFWVPTKQKRLCSTLVGIGDRRPVVIHDLTIAQVSSYKYLGVFTDNTLSWSTHCDCLCSRLQQRSHFLCCVRAHGVDNKITLIFYQAVLESLIRYGITAWFGNLPAHLRNKLLRLTRAAWEMMGVREHSSVQGVYERAILCQANKIINDASHVLQSSGRRFRVPRCRLSKTRRFKNSFFSGFC